MRPISAPFNGRIFSLAALSCFHLGFMLSGSQEIDLRGLSVLGGVLGATYFLISFFSISVGLAIMTVSMLFSPEISVGSIVGREITLRIEDFLIPVLCLSWLAQAAVQRTSRDFVKTPLNVPIFSLLILSIFSTIFGYARGWVTPAPAFFFFGKTVEYFVIFFIVVNKVSTERGVKLFLLFAIFTLTLLGFYTLLQVPSVEMFTEHRITAPFEGGRAQPSTAGGYMAFFLVIVLSLFLYEEKVLRKWALLFLLAIIFIPFLFTFSRTSYMAFAASLIVLAFLAKKKWLGYLVFFFLLLSPVILPGSVKDRIAYTWEDAKNPGRFLGVDQSLQERLMSFAEAWNRVKKSPIIGWGVASYGYVDSQYSRSLHEVGLLGLGLWFWIYIRLFKIALWLRDYLKGGILKGLALGYAAGVVAILVHACGSMTFYVIRIMEPFWFVSGLVVSLYLLKVEEYGKRERELAASA